MEKWKTAVREAQTFSRMHVLLGMLDACIKWDMSAENARCKVCRKKGEIPEVQPQKLWSVIWCVHFRGFKVYFIQWQKSGPHKVCKTMKWHFAILYYVVTKTFLFSHFQSCHPLSRFQLCALWTLIQPTFWAESWDAFYTTLSKFTCVLDTWWLLFLFYPVQLIKHFF